MRALEFEQQNVVLAKDQPEYNQLPAYFGQLGDQPNETGYVVCLELDKEEMKRVIQYGKVWVSQLTFGGKFNPINVFCHNNIFIPGNDEKEVPPADDFKLELTQLLNRHSKENGSNTPDYKLADYLIEKLKEFDDLKNSK